MAATDDVLSRSRIDAALAGLPDWRYRLGGLVTVYKAPTPAAALELIAAVGRVADEQNHHPDLDWRYTRVFLRYSSHDAGDEVTPRDVAAAGAASAAAAGLGAAAEPGLYRTVEVAIDSADPAAIAGLWRVASATARAGTAVSLTRSGAARPSGSSRPPRPTPTGFTSTSTAARWSPGLCWRRRQPPGR